MACSTRCGFDTADLDPKDENESKYAESQVKRKVSDEVPVLRE